MQDDVKEEEAEEKEEGGEEEKRRTARERGRRGCDVMCDMYGFESKVKEGGTAH